MQQLETVGGGDESNRGKMSFSSKIFGWLGVPALACRSTYLHACYIDQIYVCGKLPSHFCRHARV